jgi:RNA polymerase sigma-54 factor
MKQQLNMKMDQKLVMTPQLQMAIKLLQMQTLDLQSFVDQELLENPFLAPDDGTSENENTAQESKEKDSMEALENQSMSEDGEMALDTDWDRMYDSGRGTSGNAPVNSEDSDAWEKLATEEKSLKDHLVEQLGTSTNDRVTKFLGSYLIDAIDDAGYLKLDFAETAKLLNVDVKKLEEAHALIQTFEPAGVGATSLAECLKLQMIAKLENLSHAEEIILKNLELLAVKDYKKLAKIANAPEDEVIEICEMITGLTPKPGLKYGGSATNNIIPDVIVRCKNGKWSAELNVDAMPKLLLNNLGNIKADGEDKTYITERMNRAQWLVKSLEQRARTIFKVSNAIVKAQEDFFNYGVESLKPMTLKMIADIVESHESTISRVTNGKYMQTPKGVFELKYFFSTAIGTTGGNVSVASESVKEIIKRLISEEDARKPLSDEKLVQMLKKEGIEVARRTVAKYREGAGIPSSSGRRLRA